jgi:hypothetical protein
MPISATPEPLRILHLAPDEVHALQTLLCNAIVDTGSNRFAAIFETINTKLGRAEPAAFAEDRKNKTAWGNKIGAWFLPKRSRHKNIETGEGSPAGHREARPQETLSAIPSEVADRLHEALKAIVREIENGSEASHPRG